MVNERKRIVKLDGCKAERDSLSALHTITISFNLDGLRQATQPHSLSNTGWGIHYADLLKGLLTIDVSMRALKNAICVLS